MKFRKEYKANGEIVKGEIIGNWSSNSEYALKVKELNPLTLDEQDLEKLINELILIKEKIVSLNKEHKEKTKG